MRELNHIEIDLSGINLIEASAGTGKTYAISCLYLRLLLEHELLPEQILVVTYTEAATKELRGRIRERIHEMISVLDGCGAGDPFLHQLSTKIGTDATAIKIARDKFDLALKTFDTASIFTIHGFCLRALQDNSFESGAFYSTDLVADQTSLVQDVVDDFWRMNFFTDDAPFLTYALAKKYSPDSFNKFVKGLIGSPKLQIVPEFTQQEITNIEDRCKARLLELKEIWSSSHCKIEDIIRSDKGLRRSKDTYKLDLIDDLLDDISEFMGGDNPFALFPDFEKFTQQFIDAQEKKKDPPPQHPFFVLCGALKKDVDERFLALRYELVSFCRQRLKQRKSDLNIRCFDDLLNDLFFALRGDNGKIIAHNLRQKYRASLIDEFQDTDPVQYDIFQAIYHKSDLPLFLIGDPKQAIYSFRGADIFAYLKASIDVGAEKRFTLTGNWRSSPDLLNALNTIFTRGTNPFVYPEIAYHEITSGKPDSDGGLTFNGETSAPLQIWSIASDINEPVNVGTANKLIPPAVATEITQLIAAGNAGSAKIDDRPLVAGDIAVIVRSHRQAGMIQSALQDTGIPSVMRSDKSLFATHEAQEVFILLQALIDPGNESKLRATLVTDIFGKNGNDIAHLLDAEDEFERYLQAFRDAHQLWLKSGFMQMAQALLTTHEVRGRLLSYSDGERRVTNLLHCLEVLHQQEQQSALGLEGLATWFGERISDLDSGEEYQIRLETDALAVKIVTVHVSKGLEYPVVFCPYMWSGINDNDEVVTCHRDYQIIKDFGSPAYATNRIKGREETLAENLRLLYVALTRAKYRCYLLGGGVVGKTNKNRTATSALAYLLHSSDVVRTTTDDLVATLTAEVESLSAHDINSQLQSLAMSSADTIEANPLPEDLPKQLSLIEAKPDLGARIFKGAINSDWRVASFTSLAVHDSKFNEQPDRDIEQINEAKAEMPIAGGNNVFTFPKGAQTGIFWHELFEYLDFNKVTTEAINNLVTTGLEKYGHPNEWQPVVATMVNNVVTTKLPAPTGTFTLADLQSGSWVAEMEFFFPLKFITTARLQKCLAPYCPEYRAINLEQICASLQFKPVAGMVRGFIDMVFEYDGRYYILDWKSNHLGSQLQDYDQTALNLAMAENLYPLQYLLYTVALNRYLAQRIPDYSYAHHFGGVFYLFLRGMDSQADLQTGIFYDLPPQGLIAQLDEILIQAEGANSND